MVAEMVARGVDNQFVDLEAFVLDAPAVSEGEGSVVIKTMEVNCRTFCNQLPIFSKLFGGGDGDAEAKAHVTDTASKTTLRPTDSERQSVYSPITVAGMVAAVAAFAFWLHG